MGGGAGSQGTSLLLRTHRLRAAPGSRVLGLLCVLSP